MLLCTTKQLDLNKPLPQRNILESIADKINDKKIFLSVHERYYEHKYCVALPGISQDIHQKVGFHTNRVCLLSLAENHPIRKEDKNISRINFKVSETLDRLQNKVSGKSKRGAQKLHKSSIICYIECSDDTNYPVYSCVEGKLVEINDKLITNPNLLKAKPDSDGYIALLLPVLSMYEDLKSSMLTKEQYFCLGSI
ncbi:Glycine cleavage H-protein [Popillia japonica]|uniref:Protein Abitram n=1 Tax=Popillia japonica TaxID=7064 RepID=A0AAW1JHV8_POPJA